jgi:hypothetical protein
MWFDIPEREEQYLVPGPTPRTRIRVTITWKPPHGTTHFCVALEWQDPNSGWHHVARYDSTGGVPHRDILLPPPPDENYLVHHETINAATLDKAVTIAKDDFKHNYQEYVQRWEEAFHENVC